jgi:hypothetical protein
MKTTTMEDSIDTRVYTPTKQDKIALLEEQSSIALTKKLQEQPLPHDDESTAIQIYRLNSFGLRKQQIAKLLEELTPLITNSTEEVHITRFRQNLRHIIYALVAAFYNHEWLAIPSKEVHYQANERLGKLGFSRRRVKRIIEVLISEGLAIKGRGGFKHWGDPSLSKASQYYPTAQLINYFSGCLYEFENEMSLETYHDFNNFPEGTLPNPELYAKNDDLLREYNLFMQNHWWARKGPTTRSFSENLNRGGRLNNSYQTIVNRRIKIRENTLLDGERIAEPDFSANHLRMSAALLGEEMPNDPYEAITASTGATRQQAKAFITRVIGCSSLRQKGGQIKSLYKPNKDNLSPDLYRSLLSAFYKEYPWLETKKVFYNDTGARMQILEGEIGLKMCRWAIDTNTPLISVHDSYACIWYHKEQVWDAMQEFWDETIKLNKK